MHEVVWCIFDEIWLIMMIMSEWNDVKMDGFINKIMTSWKSDIPPH